MRRPRGDNHKWVLYASRLVRSRRHEAQGYLLHSLLGHQAIHQARPFSVYQFFQRARVTPPSDAATVRRLCLRPRRSLWRETTRRRPSPSFACGYRLLDCTLTDRPSTSVDASIRLGHLQRMIRITAGIKRQFVLDLLFEEDTLHACYQNFLDSSFKFKTR